MNINMNIDPLSAPTTAHFRFALQQAGHSVINIEARLIGENSFEGMSYLPWKYFDELLTIGMLKKIKKDYCQNNRDKARMKNVINPSKEIILEQQLDLELINKGSYHGRGKVYYAAKHGHVIKAMTVVHNTIRADPTRRLIGILPNNTSLYVRYYVVKKSMDLQGYNYIDLNNSTERVGCIIQATFSGINRPYGKTLDHRNGFRHDDRFSNTRWATSKEQRANQHNRTNIMNRVVNPPIPFKNMDDATVDFNKHPELDLYVSDSFPTYFYNNKRNRFVHGYQGAKYRRMKFNGKTYQSGRLGIEAITNTLLQPLECVDHLTGTTNNDSISSLRKTHACGNALNHKHHRAGTIRPNTRVAPRKLTVNGLPRCEVLQSGICILRKMNGDLLSRPYKIQTRIGPPNERTQYHAYFETLEDAKEQYKIVRSEHSVPYLPKEYRSLRSRRIWL